VCCWSLSCPQAAEVSFCCWRECARHGPAFPAACAGFLLLALDAPRSFGKQYWTRQLLASGIVHFAAIGAFWALALALSLEISLADHVLLVPLLFLVSLLPVSFAGWGLREAGCGWLVCGGWCRSAGSTERLVSVRPHSHRCVPARRGVLAELGPSAQPQRTCMMPGTGKLARVFAARKRS